MDELVQRITFGGSWNQFWATDFTDEHGSIHVYPWLYKLVCIENEFY